MDRKEFLGTFARMSDQDRIAIRADLIRSSHFEEAPGAGSAVATCLAIMEAIRAGGEPMAVCREMLEEVSGICPS